MAQLGEQERSFIDQNPYVGVVTTLRNDGSPHSTIVWMDVDDGKISFNTARGRAKDRHLQHDPRVSVVVVDPSNAYKWVAVTGRAELTEDGADAQIDKLAKKYIDKDEYPGRSPTETRVKVLIAPEKVDATGFDEQ
jgi:PPOX class probable F420-dependent enzyme